jgi:GPH family glycoside/pentoside/hexuronide:cation symporter
LCTYFGFSLASVAYQAWGAELGRDAGERTRLTASREGFGLLGVVLAAALPGLLSNDLAQGLSGLAQIFPCSCCCWRAGHFPRHPPAVERLPASGKLFGDLRSVLDDGRFRGCWRSSWSMASPPPCRRRWFCSCRRCAAGRSLERRLSRALLRQRRRLPAAVGRPRQALRPRAHLGRISMFVAVASFVWAWGSGAGDVWPFAVVCLLSGAALGADLTLPAALLADLCERPAGGRAAAQAGAYFGWWNLVAKLNLALAAGLSLPLLDLVGYRPGEGGATAGLAAVYCLLPLLFKSAAAVLAWRWRGTLEVS